MSRIPHVDQAARIADAVGEHIEGQRVGSHLVARVRAEFSDTDELFRAVELARGSSLDRLRGLCRAVQKALESAR